MDKSIFTKMLKYINKDEGSKDSFLLEILGTTLYKDIAFCDQLLYEAGIEAVDRPNVYLDDNAVMISQGDEVLVKIISAHTYSSKVGYILSNSNYNQKLLIVIGEQEEIDSLSFSNESYSVVGFNFMDLAMIIDETCSDITIELHQFLVENYLVKESESN